MLHCDQCAYHRTSRRSNMTATDTPRNREWNMPMTQRMNGEAIEILLVEDSPDDIVLTTDALRDGKVRNRVSVVEDGEEAMAFLRRQGHNTAAPRPDLILLDLNL